MKWFLPVIFLFIFLSCKHQKPELSFYYWKAAPLMANDSFDVAEIKQLNVQHFYIHYMDVDWNAGFQMPVPRAWINDYDDKIRFLNQAFSPVVYITNNAFLKMDSALCDTLAFKLSRAINATNQKFSEAYNEESAKAVWAFHKRNHHFRDTSNANRASFPTIKEIQIDCDWTSKTKDKYFYFLTKFKKQFPDIIISATIRLYPYKYTEKMGVPPVDKGMLMCYNLGNITSSTTQNSILDTKQLKQYLSGKNYPLPLDIALPVFGWYAWFRGAQFKGIIYKNKEDNLDSFLTLNSGNSYQARQDFEVQQQYVRQGDVLRSEFPTEEQLLDAARLLKENVNHINRVSFYHWDEDLLKNYESTIQKVYSIF